MEIRCQKCNEEFEPGFDVCWNCGTDMDGNTVQDFIRPEDQPEDPEGFVNALNVVGWLTGTFQIIKQSESKPIVKGDFVLPEWAVPVIVGIVLCVVAVFIKHSVVAWLGVGAIGIGGIKFLIRKFL